MKCGSAAVGYGLTQGLQPDDRTVRRLDVQVPGEHDVSGATAENIDDYRVFHTGLGPERGPAGIKIALIVIGDDRSQVAKRKASVNADGGVEAAAEGGEGGDTVSGSDPAQP